jgi:hypothetical protein
LGIELFERVAESRGRLLRVQQLISPGRSDDPSNAAGYLLTFDVGRILVLPAPSSEGVVLTEVKDESEIEAALALLDEEDPWWRVLGNSITRAWPGVRSEGAASGGAETGDVRLQFREDSENPKVISLSYAAGSVRVATESAHAD